MKLLSVLKGKKPRMTVITATFLTLLLKNHTIINSISSSFVLPNESCYLLRQII